MASRKTENCSPENGAIPFLRWAGSKRQLIPILLEKMPKAYDRYVEPFAGSACFFFALQPQKAILNDFNNELINAYQVVRDSYAELYSALTLFPNEPTFYYEIRSMNPSELSPFERACRFIYLNRHCFNGVYRTDKEGHFNVPIGSRFGKLPSKQTFGRCASLLKRATLLSGDFNLIEKRCRKDDFIYLDPPYTSSKRMQTGQYGPTSFSSNDLPRLMRLLDTLDQKGCKFLLSYAAVDEVIKLSDKKWGISYLSVYRHISGFHSFRGRSSELLIQNY